MDISTSYELPNDDLSSKIKLWMNGSQILRGGFVQIYIYIALTSSDIQLRRQLWFKGFEKAFCQSCFTEVLHSKACMII